MAENVLPAMKSEWQEELRAVKGAAHKSSQHEGERTYNLTSLHNAVIYVKRRVKELESVTGATQLVKLVQELERHRATPALAAASIVPTPTADPPEPI